MSEKRKILIVDDEESFCRLVKLNLERTGKYLVSMEHTGTKALGQARAFAPDLVLLDVILPDRDGFAVYRDIRSDSSLKDVPVIFLTASVVKDESGPPSPIPEYGAPFLPKPVGTDELVCCIEKLLEKGRES
jgi:DNA-binding response OmpR family regulator